MLPIQLLNQCHLVSLSELAPNNDCQLLLPKLTTSSNTLQYLCSLLTILSCLPQFPLGDLQTLPPMKHLLIFLLSSFHTHISINSPTQLYNLVYSLSQLLTYTDLSTSILLLFLQSIVYNLYCTVPSTEDLNDIINLYIREDLLQLQDKSSISVNEHFTLPLPSSVTSPQHYNDHVAGVLKSILDDKNSTLK